MASCEFLGINVQPARKATGTDKSHIERTLGSVASLFAQYAAGYTGRSPNIAGGVPRTPRSWPLPEPQDLLDQVDHRMLAETGRMTDCGTRCCLCEFTPNEKYAALVETAVLAAGACADDHVQLLPACWRSSTPTG